MYKRQTPNGYDKIPQIGIVILEDKVDIGANTCVDRATMGATIVHSGAKIDNLVQIAHNDEIGSHTAVSYTHLNESRCSRPDTGKTRSISESTGCRYFRLRQIISDYGKLSGFDCLLYTSLSSFCQRY